MKNTLFNLIISLLSHGDVRLIKAKLDTITNQLTLNEVDKRIITDITESIQVGNLVSPSFIKQKYSYASANDENLIDVIIPVDAIDSAITDLMIEQSKRSLKKDILELGSTIDKLPTNELKQKISGLLENKLLEGRAEIPANNLKKLDSMYSEVSAKQEGLSLAIPRIEEYAGKALPGTVVTILGFAGSFKSTFSMQVAYENALAGKNILYLALESTSKALINRLTLNHIASTETNRAKLIKANWLRDSKLSQEQIDYYDSKHTELVEMLDDRLIIWDEQDVVYDTFLDMNDTLRKADQMFMEKTGSGLDGFVLDQLALLKFTSAGGKKYGYDGAVLNDWVSYLRKQALNFLDTGREIVVYMVSQINRESYMEASKPKKKGRYDITAASDANEIERASSTMITLYKDLDTANALLVNIPKAREGQSPDNPLQLEVHGDYFHIGPLKVTGGTMTYEDLESDSFDLSDLIN